MLFTLLIWLLLFLIYISNRKNKTNQWCVISGLILSIGTLKEYLYFDLAPALFKQFGQFMTNELLTAIYSVLTAVLYLTAMPSTLMLALHFSFYPAQKPNRYKILRAVNYLPAFLLCFVFPPYRFSELQHDSRAFWVVLMIYNLYYGAVMTFLMIRSVLAEKLPRQRQQKRLVCLVVLPPVWYWLVSIFVIHSLGITSLMKIWQNNSVIVSIVLVFYIAAAFREGIMGMRLHGESYGWDSDMKTASKGAQYTSHILKNEVTKIDWCASNLSKKCEQVPEELAIIQRSTEHLLNFVNKTQLYSNDIMLQPERVPVKELIRASILSTRDYAGVGVTFEGICGDNAELYCDREHILEVLNNLLSNAADAMEKEGTVTITFSENPAKKLQALSVKDTGKGIDKSDLLKLFDPYYTTKKTNAHFGLGLSYCANVLKKHGGYIDVKSEPGKGAEFILNFPMQA